MRQFREIDGSDNEGGRVTLPVSVGLPYNLAKLMGQPTYMATLKYERADGTTVLENWELPDGRRLRTWQDVRFVQAESSEPIGRTRNPHEARKPLPVYQIRPPRI